MEKDNKNLKNNILQNTKLLENNNIIDSKNIMESQIFGDNNLNNNIKNKNKSMNPYLGMPGMSLKGSIMPLGNFGEIKEENEEFNSINDENKKSQKEDEKEEKKEDSKGEESLGMAYMEDDFESDEKDKKEFKKKEKKIKQSRLKMSYNNNIFNFTAKNDENYVVDLENEINNLYKNRDKMEDLLNDQTEKINKKDKELKESVIQNDKLRKIIEEKNKEIEQLKKK